MYTTYNAIIMSYENGSSGVVTCDIYLNSAAQYRLYGPVYNDVDASMVRKPHNIAIKFHH